MVALIAFSRPLVVALLAIGPFLQRSRGAGCPSRQLAELRLVARDAGRMTAGRRPRGSFNGQMTLTGPACCLLRATDRIVEIAQIKTSSPVPSALDVLGTVIIYCSRARNRLGLVGAYWRAPSRLGVREWVTRKLARRRN